MELSEALQLPDEEFDKLTYEELGDLTLDVKDIVFPNQLRKAISHMTHRSLQNKD